VEAPLSLNPQDIFLLESQQFLFCLTFRFQSLRHILFEEVSKETAHSLNCFDMHP